MLFQIKRGSAWVLCLVLLLSLVSGIPRAGAAEPETLSVDVVFTHDLHDHLDEMVVEGDGSVRGGAARIKTILDSVPGEKLVLDAGDFSMGSLFQTLYMQRANELRMLGILGFDATTFGNHEYDYRTEGLVSMLTAAKDSGDPLPALVVSNLRRDNPNAQQKLLLDAFDAYGVKAYVMTEKNGVSIAIIGLMGIDSADCAPTCVLEFEDPIEAAKEVVAEIRSKEQADMIVCVSHGGTNTDAKKSEDEKLAKAVPEIDLIISGHTHTELPQPIVSGDSYIVSAGEYGKNVGTLRLTQNARGRWTMEDYALIPTTEDIPQNPDIQALVERNYKQINEDYLSKFGYTADEVLARNEVEFCSVKDTEFQHTELTLGNFLSDAMRASINAIEGITPVDVTIVPSGCIRGSYSKGGITVKQVFESYSLGIGPDGIPGYPLVGVYLSGRELRTIGEIDASISDYMTTTRLFFSGMHFSFNPNRFLLDRVTDAYLVGENGQRVEIENDRLYRVAADLYSGQMLGAVTQVSKGLLTVVPKDENGNPIENLEDYIIYDQGRELKAWDAIARYMKHLPGGEIPASYHETEGRKVVIDDGRWLAVLANPNRFTIAFAGIGVVAVALVLLLGRFLWKRVQKRNHK